ncbi:MAG TPA: hypothetical protein VN865_15025, partial [Candidatus Acidoferrales bacterium]|nr:hypothetical protein [Candidatus Acidoferrales bacterium]
FQVRIDGAEIPVSMTILPMRHDEGPISGVVCIATAIGRSLREVRVASAREESHPPRHASALSIH